MQTIVYHSKARKTMCGMGTFCLIGMISFQLTMQNSEAIKCMFGISDRDLNNATHPGIYLVDFGASSVKNGPDTGEYFTGALFIINSGNFLIQLFFDGNQYFRKRFYNSWTAWIKTTRDL